MIYKNGPIIEIVSGILSKESDYYAEIIKDNDCVGNRNIVIKLFDDYCTGSKISEISKNIRCALSIRKYDVSTMNTANCQSQVLDEIEGVEKRCIIIRTSENPST